jgi:hypothetical protein
MPSVQPTVSDEERDLCHARLRGENALASYLNAAYAFTPEANFVDTARSAS